MAGLIWTKTELIPVFIFGLIIYGIRSISMLRLVYLSVLSLANLKCESHGEGCTI